MGLSEGGGGGSGGEEGRGRSAWAQGPPRSSGEGEQGAGTAGTSTAQFEVIHELVKELSARHERLQQTVADQGKLMEGQGQKLGSLEETLRDHQVQIAAQLEVNQRVREGMEEQQAMLQLVRKDMIGQMKSTETNMCDFFLKHLGGQPWGEEAEEKQRKGKKFGKASVPRGATPGRTVRGKGP